MSDVSVDHDRWNEELAAYLLGALPPEEATECRRHLERCERCRAEARWLAPAVEQLPQSAGRVEPPAQLRERLMAEVREDARSRGAEAGGSRHGKHARGLERPRRLPIGPRPLAGLAAVLLVLAGIGGYLIGNGGSNGERTSTSVAGRAPGVIATVVRGGDSATLRLTNVRPLPPQRVLEAWVRRRGRIEPVKALFVPDREGHARTTIGNMRGVDAVMVTTEPPGGSNSPTSAPIVTVPVQ